MNDRCAARQTGDMTRCIACRLTWDTNDPEPPACPRQVQVVASPSVVPEPVGFVSGLSVNIIW